MEPQLLSAGRLRESTTVHSWRPEAQNPHRKDTLNSLPNSKSASVTSYNNDSEMARDNLGKTSVETSQHAPHPEASKPSLTKRLFSYRSVMVLLMHGSFMVTVIQRDCMSMAIVCMYDGESTPENSSSASSSSLNSSAGINSSLADNANDIKRNVPEWDSNVRGLIISAGTFTSFLSPVLAQFLSRHFGGKWALVLILGTGCLLLFLSPIVARTDLYLMIAVRVIVGTTYGGNIPILSEFIGWWAPSSEKLTMNSIIYTGFNTASVLLFFVSGIVCSIPLDGGWPFIFYTNGFISLIWLILWITFSSRLPEDHRFISEEEKQYIIENRPVKRETRREVGKTPYFKILKSAPVIALIFCAAGHLWSVTLIVSFAPVYLNEAIHFSTQETGVIMSVASVVRFLAAFVFTYLGNCLVKRTTVTWSRKIVFCLGYGLASASFFALAVAQDYSRFVAVGLILIIFSSQMAGTGTLAVIPIDIAPQYASFISTAWFCVGALTAISAPLLATFLTSEGTLEAWRNVWYISGCLFTTMVFMFLVFGDAKLQPWAQELPHFTPARSISITIDNAMSIHPKATYDSSNLWISNYLNNESYSSDRGIDNPRFEMELYPDITSNANEDSRVNDTSTQKIQNAANNSIRYQNSHEISKCSKVALRTRL